ncbi:MAG TPA: tRNA 2-selenouridine(34) synthase MnmH [Segetibacter sp.]|nr:tRNA 2-selenouridine(34) synthase MnmH [Segetibacter sp.]
MAVTRIDIETFLDVSSQHPVIDVRSEGEFAHAHIPGAVSMPLFNNEERKVVGTAYKQQSKQQAIKLGLAIFGKKMVEMVEFVERLLESHPKYRSSKTLIVHCWRGGMRSGGVGWLLDMYGFKVYTIVGGYKAFRRWSLQQLEKDYRINILGGYTGSGKTFVLQQLKKQHMITIDLEDLARHKGSAFGSIGMPEQPSQEMFENLLAVELFKADMHCKMEDAHSEATEEWTGARQQPNRNIKNEVVVSHPGKPMDESDSLSACIWMEDESQRIGLVNLPTAFFKNIRNKPVYFLEIPFEERLKHIVGGYGKGDKQEIASAIIRIQKRLGGLEAKTALNFLIEDNLEETFRILLKYYDKQYLKGLHSRENLQQLLHTIECDTVDAEKNAALIFAKQTEQVNV